MTFQYIYRSLLCLFVVWYSCGISLAQKSSTNLRVVIDPGHGGTDPGNPGFSGFYNPEAAVNLKVSKLVAKKLKDAGIEVILTREKDVFVELSDRVSIANKKQAQLFVSIHSNANPNPKIAGTRTHYNSRFDQESKYFAGLMERTLTAKAGRHSRGYMSEFDRGYGLKVLREAKMTAVLVECGFLSNPVEEKYLNSTKGQEEIANAIALATLEYLKSRYPEKFYTNSNYYQVQILASNKPIPVNTNKDFSKQLKALGIQEYVAQNTPSFRYKYLVGKTTNKEKGNDLLKKVKQLGYSDAFLVSYPIY